MTISKTDDIFAAYARTAPLEDLRFYLRAAERKLAEFELSDGTLRIIGEMAALELQGVDGTPALKKRVWNLIDRYKGSIPGWGGSAGAIGSWAEPIESATVYHDAQNALVRAGDDDHAEGPVPLDRLQEWYLPVWTKAETLGRVRVPLRSVPLEPGAVRDLIQISTPEIVEEPTPKRAPQRKPCPTCADAAQERQRAWDEGYRAGRRDVLEPIAKAKPVPRAAGAARVSDAPDKLCTKCHTTQPIDEFCPGTHERTICRQCRQAYRRSLAERKRAA